MLHVHVHYRQQGFIQDFSLGTGGGGGGGIFAKVLTRDWPPITYMYIHSQAEAVRKCGHIDRLCHNHAAKCYYRLFDVTVNNL